MPLEPRYAIIRTMQIYFVKHGKTPSASEMRLSEDDEGLSDKGIAEAKAAAQALKARLNGTNLAKIISSPRKRTYETANIIANAFGIDVKDVEYDKRLIERDCGPYTGQLIADVFSKSEKELTEGGMEPLQNLYERSERFYNEIKIKDVTGCILLVGHSGNLAPLIFAAKGAHLGDAIVVPDLSLDDVLRLN